MLLSFWKFNENTSRKERISSCHHSAYGLHTWFGKIHAHVFLFPPHHHHHQQQRQYHLVPTNVMVMQARRTGKLFKQQQNRLLFISIFIEFIDMLWLLSVVVIFFSPPVVHVCWEYTHVYNVDISPKFTVYIYL